MLMSIMIEFVIFAILLLAKIHWWSIKYPAIAGYYATRYMLRASLRTLRVVSSAVHQVRQRRHRARQRKRQG